MDILKEIFFVYWFFLPVGLANVAAFFSGKIPYIKELNHPVDFKLTFRKKRIFGSHKTIRGFILGIIVGIIIVYFQILIYENSIFMREILPVDYSGINPILFGFLSGFGALAGDAIKSFFKRQMGIIPGRSWFPFDQVDFILGGIIFTWFYIPLSLEQYLIAFIMGFLLHPTTTFLAFLFKLKRKPL